MGTSKNSGYIKLFRKITTWEWYSDPVTRDLFIHCLLMANWEPGTWQGHPYKRGEFFTSYRKLSQELGYSVRQTRTALKHLQMTQELTLTSTSKYTLISIQNYDEYQEGDTVGDKQSAQSATHKVTTDKEEKNIRIKEISLNMPDGMAEELKRLYGDRADALIEDVRRYYEGHPEKDFPGWKTSVAQFNANQARWGKKPRKREMTTEEMLEGLL